MAAKGGASTRHTRVHLKDKEFTLYVTTRGLFSVLAPTGRYTEALLGVLVADFLSKPGFLALELSHLDAVSLPLIRALCDFAADLDPEKGRMVLINPPERIRGLVKLVGGEGKVTMILSKKDLEGELGEVDARIRRSHDHLFLVRTMLASNPSWQLVDLLSRWLCPFCVTLRDDVRIVAHGSPTPQVVDRVARHLAEDCSTYTAGQTDGWPFEVLERAIRAANSESDMVKPPPLRPAPDPSETKRRRRAEAEEDGRRRHMLPRTMPTIPGCDLAITYRPAPVQSGDFFDFVRLSGGRVGVIVGDISSPDVEPGVLMGVARKVLQIRLRDMPDPTQALALANDDLCEELDQESYVSAAVAIVDGERRELRLARAGHAAPFLVRGGKVTRLELPGPVLGFVPTASFEQGFEMQSFPLEPGDLFLLHTDGLEETENRKGEKFGADRVAAVLRACGPMEASRVVSALTREAEQFAEETSREEDLTVLCLKVR